MAQQTLFITGGGWWGQTSPDNLGHQCLRESALRHLRLCQPTYLKLYMGTRQPPPLGTLQVWLEGLAEEAEAENATVKNQGLATSELSLPSAELSINGQPRLSICQFPLDLSSPPSIVTCASAFLELEPKLDILVSNAVIMPATRRTVSLPTFDDKGKEMGLEDVEVALMTNVIGPGVLFELLQVAIKKAADANVERPRLVLVSSDLHRKADAFDISPNNLDNLLATDVYGYQKTYSITKCIQTIHQYGLHDRLGNTVGAFSVSPGFVPSTSLNRSTPYLLRLLGTPLLNLLPFVSTPEQAGKRIANACFEEDFEVGVEADVKEAENNDSLGEGAAMGPKRGQAVYLKNDKIVKPGAHVLDERLRGEWMSWIDERVRTFTPPSDPSV